MSLNMYLGEVQNQTQSMNAVCTATIQGMEQVIQSIDAFAIDTVLQGQTYSSAKSFFVQTFRPLAQGIIYLCEELILQNDAFPSQFQSQVASTDVIEQEILEQIREIDRMKASMEVISQAMPIPGVDAMANLFTVMRKKLQEKLEHLYEFNYTSSNNYDTALQLAASIATGLAEVQSGKGFSPASGTFSAQGLNMEWTTSIQAITEERARQAANSIDEGAMCGKLPEKSTLEKTWEGILDGTGQAVSDTIDGIKALGDWETWENMGNAALHPIDTLSTMYNALSDSFINDVINGDAKSRARWGSYALTQVGLGLIGDKGISKVTTLAKGTNLAKVSEGISHYTNKLQTGDRFAYAGVGEFRDIPKTSFNSLEEARNTFMFAAPGNLNTPKFQEYLGQVEEITNRKIPENQKELLQEALEDNAYSKLSKEETAQRRAEFDKLRTNLIKDWELKTGQKWPTYEEVVYSKKGLPLRKKTANYDAHHIIESTYNGAHEWWNLHPAKYPDEHQGGIHGKGKIAKEIFKR
ncbi:MULTISPECIES: T7SS effector LXG polymorphic toxin [Bacillus]|uniref:T7SS effector LXG polymorphic toxin n=1 Tax=Bacillus TaxID=1386 RepID=UPI000DC4D347|nr:MULTISPECIES: T7SS effector LXG polymorphic toxin [Bacillus]RAN70019.1 cytoplasmic protein [Bacillus sp. SRB_8]WJE63223.1 T7SS effector LXG polymorphic toxin [Bacillus mycoides]